MDAVDQILEQWRQVRPDLDVSAMGPIGRLSRVFHHHARQMNETFARHGINAAGFDVLATLRRAGPPYALSPGELMGSMMITSGTMTNRIDQLIKQGLVSRAKDPGDARRVVVKLTSTGFDLIDQAVAAHVKTQSALLAALSDQEIAALDDGLRKLMAASELDSGD